MKRATIVRMERIPTANMMIKHAFMLAQAFDCKIEDLFEREDDIDVTKCALPEGHIDDFMKIEKRDELE